MAPGKGMVSGCGVCSISTCNLGLYYAPRVVFDVAVGLVGLTSLELQPVLNRFRFDKRVTKRHHEIEGTDIYIFLWPRV